MTAKTGGNGRAFLILHGWENRRPVDHWQHWLADELLNAGELVAYPQLPDPDEPRLEEWLDSVQRHLTALGALDVTVVCHSLACSLWVTYGESGRPMGNVVRVALVAVPSPAVLASEIVAPFVADHTAIAQHGGQGMVIVAGDDDPYCPEGVGRAYRLDPLVPLVTLPGAEHIRPSSGYGPWPAMLEWCLGDTDAPFP
jgi:predicted alpha/beta hydrolase family esterase